MSRVCRMCGVRKESDQFPRGSNGNRLATCQACRDTPVPERVSMRAHPVAANQRVTGHPWLDLGADARPDWSKL